MGPLVKSSVRKTLWATSSAPRLLALMNATISHTFTNTLKVSSNELHKLKCSFNGDLKNFIQAGAFILYCTELFQHVWSLSGSEEERIAVETACKYGSKAEAFSSPTAEDVSLEVSMDGKGPMIGQDPELTIMLRNSSTKQRKVLLHGQVAVMYYTGVHKAWVRKDTTEVDLLPNEGE